MTGPKDWANIEQQEYMAYLANRGPENLCWCGWYELNLCPHASCKVTHAGQSAADKLAFIAACQHDLDPVVVGNRRLCRICNENVKVEA